MQASCAVGRVLSGYGRMFYLVRGPDGKTPAEAAGIKVENLWMTVIQNAKGRVQHFTARIGAVNWTKPDLESFL